MSRIVVPYANPDLDGVACAIAIAMLDTRWSASVIGAIDDETSVVLSKLGIERPPTVGGWEEVREIWLVDTHHPKQLPDDFPHHLVTRITDHHPAGDVARYSRAEIQNEAVGAAATLVAERYAKEGGKPLPDIARLLQAAILSNTLEFAGPATSDRDRKAFSQLSSIAALGDDTLAAMRDARRGVLALPTSELLERDAKTFETRFGTVAIGQVEAPGSLEVLERPDLHDALHAFAARRRAQVAMLSIVDSAAGRGAIVCTDKSVTSRLSSGHKVAVGSDGILHFGRLIQRKTDILPFITE